MIKKTGYQRNVLGTSVLGESMTKHFPEPIPGKARIFLYCFSSQMPAELASHQRAAWLHSYFEPQMYCLPMGEGKILLVIPSLANPRLSIWVKCSASTLLLLTNVYGLAVWVLHKKGKET